MSLDWSKWALIAPNDDTGLGRMAQDMKAVLPVGRHLAAPSSRIAGRPLVAPRDVSMLAECSLSELEEHLSGLQGVIFFERHDWHPALLRTARRMGVRSVCVPMWEWFRGVSPQWLNCDFFACPNEFCLRIVRSYGFENAELVPWTLDLSRLPVRVVRGEARHFVHNAGLIDPDDRKGTHAALAAFARIRNPALRLTVRMQKAERFAIRDARVSCHAGNLADPSALYAEGDAFIQPSKLEGMGFMVLEAVASGLPVITLDVPPVNEWGRQPELFARASRFCYPAYSSAWIEHSHLRLPILRELVKKIAWAASHDLADISRRNREWALEAFEPAMLRDRWETLLSKILAAPRREIASEAPEPSPPCLSPGASIRRAVASLTGLRLPFFGFLP